MIEIYLDGTQLEVPQDISIGLNLGIANYSDPISASGAYTQTIDIPRTPHNDKAFKFSGEVLSADSFNHSEHTARIVEDGCELVAGRAFLEGSSQKVYRLQVVGEEIGWVENIRDKKMSELDGEAIGRFQPDEWSEIVGQSAEYYPKLTWTMMQHGHWYQDTDDEPIRRTWATYNDLIPMVKLHTLLEHCFAGQTIVANEALKKALHQTYVTMQWKADEKAQTNAEDFDFELASKMLSVDEDGEVKVILTAGEKAKLPIFDTIEEDKNGVLKLSIDGAYRIYSFFPNRDCNMALEVETKYQTSTAYTTTTFQDKDGGWDDVAMANPSFADQLYTSENADFPFVQFRIEDSLEWGAKTQYIPFETGDWKTITLTHNDEGFTREQIEKATTPDIMPLCYFEVDDPNKYTSIGYLVWYYTDGLTTDRSVLYYHPTQTYVGNKNIVRSNLSRIYQQVIKGGKVYTLYVVPALRRNDGKICYMRNTIGSWVSSSLSELEDNDVCGYLLSDNQRLTFDVALKTPVRKYNKNARTPINSLYFGCSTLSDKDITVYGTADGSLKPSFEWGGPIRESVRLQDVGGDTLAEDMLRSVMQLYNLFIYTNPKTKQVHLYSFADFWNNNIVDWSDRVDLDSDISVSAMGDDIGKSVTLQYADGNPRIDYYNDRHSLPYFAYKQALSTKMTKEDREIANSLFSPAYMTKVADEFGSGEGNIPAVAEKDKEGNVLDFNLADVPHTLVLIPEGEESADYAQLPIYTEVFGDVGGIQPPMSAEIPGVTTLSFADKNGIEGLHTYYDKQIALWEKARRLSCYCRIEAWEIEAMRYNSDNINFRSLFKLDINGENVYGRLESIEYEPSNTTNKCIFIIE